MAKSPTEAAGDSSTLLNMVAEPGVHGINAPAGASTPGSRGPLGDRQATASPLGVESPMEDNSLDLSLTPDQKTG